MAPVSKEVFPIKKKSLLQRVHKRYLVYAPVTHNRCLRWQRKDWQLSGSEPVWYPRPQALLQA